MLGKLYLRPLHTAAGNVGAEWLFMVPAAAVVAARQSAEDARSRANEARRALEFRQTAKALHGAAGAWIAERGKR